MGKIVAFLALVSLLFVFIGSLAFPQNPIMWLATITYSFTVLRIVLITLLATLLIAGPFIDHHLYRLLGAFGLILCSWTLYATYSNHLQILDSLAFLSAGISFGIEAMQAMPEPAEKQSGTEHTMRHRLASYALGSYTYAKNLSFRHPISTQDAVISPSKHKTAAV